MHWITERKAFEETHAQAKKWMETNDQKVGNDLARLTFDASELCTASFFKLLQALMGWAKDGSSRFLVMSPDPVNYFLSNFARYPLVEISSEDSLEQYLACLNTDPGESPADAIGINWMAYVIVSPSNSWFIRGVRSDHWGGDLWLPAGWVRQAKEQYQYFPESA